MQDQRGRTRAVGPERQDKRDRTRDAGPERQDQRGRTREAGQERQDQRDRRKGMVLGGKTSKAAREVGGRTRGGRDNMG